MVSFRLLGVQPEQGAEQLRALANLLGPAAVDGPADRRLAMIVALAAGLAWAAIMFLLSSGSATDDEIGHFLIARDAWFAPELLLNEWGRTANTLIYAVPALAGLPAARVWSLLLSFVTALFATRAAKQLGATYYWTVPLFLWFQPWFASLSFVAITEVPFSLFAIVSASFFLERRLLLASLAVGLLPLLRHEGILLVGLWLMFCLCRRQWVAMLSSLLPLAMYNVVSFATFGAWPFVIYVVPKPTDFYGGGDWLHFVPRLAAGVGVPVSLIALFAIAAILRAPERMLLFGWYAAYFATHVALFGFGLFATGGYQLLLFPLAPAVAIAAAFGLMELLKMLRNRFPDRWERSLVHYLVVAMMSVILGVGLSARPHQARVEQLAVQQAVAWIRESGLSNENLVATHVWFYYFMPQRVDPTLLWTGVPDAHSMEKGTVVVWDSHYSDRWGLDRAALMRPDSGWIDLGKFGDGTVIVLQKR